MSHVKALVLGHSFVHRLRRWMKDNDKRMCVGMTDIHGVGGRTVEKIHKYDLSYVRKTRPDTVFLQIGGNDISVETTAESVTNDIILLANELNKLGVKKVVIGSVFMRPNPKGMTASHYERKKKAINKKLYKTFGKFNRVNCDNQRTLFFQHRFPKMKHFSSDGVHLNDDGHKELFYSIRSALLKIL